jgi:putative transposase
VNGRKRHIVVDTVGHLLKVVVHPAHVQDRDGAWDVFEAMAGHFPHLSLVWADQGYTGDLENLCEFAYGWRLEIVKRAPQQGFSLLPRRWVVERTFAWLSTFRRLSRDFEQLTSLGETWIYAAMSRLLLRRLTK